jgi:drug/metabolite transporter (DMT)-like permease
MSLRSSRKHFIPAAVLLVLSLLWAAGSLRADLLADSAGSSFPTLESAAIPLAFLAVAAAFIAFVRRAPWPRGKQWLSALSAAAGLFVAPTWLLRVAQDSVPSLTRVVLFSLVPVFAVVLEPHFDPNARRISCGLVASLAAVLGMLLVFPLDLPGSPVAAAGQGALVLAAVLIAASNCFAVQAARVLPPRALASFAAVVAAFAAAALLLSSFAAIQPRFRIPAQASALLWPLLVDLPALALLFWLFRHLSAVRMTTRFLLAPLLATLISALILAPHISLRDACGLLLLAASASWLLFASIGPCDAEASSLRLTRD